MANLGLPAKKQEKKDVNYYTPYTAQTSNGINFAQTYKTDETYVDPHTGSAYSKQSSEPINRTSYSNTTKPLVTKPSGNSGGNGGGSGGSGMDYQGLLGDLYNKVMGYGSYTPGRYSAKYDTSGLEGQLQGWLNEIDNYGDFEYDLNADLLYKQMADNYVQQGQLAMQDTMAQAATLTGGYGNSYAAAVGNQAYQQRLTQLNNNIPALQQQALNVWQAGLDQLYGQLDAGSQQLNNLLNLEAQNFAQWQANEQNAYNAWLANYNQVMDQYNLGVDYIGQMQALAPRSYSGGSSGSTSAAPQSTNDKIVNAIVNGNTNLNLNNGAVAGALLSNPMTSQTYLDYLEALKKM